MMKGKIFKRLIILLLLITVIWLTSCGEKENYPKEIPFTEYSLEETSCQWKNLNYDESVIVINNNEELENYIDCADGAYSKIDFSKNTLLLASGYTSGVEQANVTSFLQNAVKEYTLEMDLLLNTLAVMVEWDAAVLVPKISNETNIILTIKFEGR